MGRKPSAETANKKAATKKVLPPKENANEPGENNGDQGSTTNQPAPQKQDTALNKPIKQEILDEPGKEPAAPKRTGTKNTANPNEHKRVNVRDTTNGKLHKNIPSSTVASWQKKNANKWVIED